MDVEKRLKNILIACKIADCKQVNLKQVIEEIIDIIIDELKPQSGI